MTRKEFERTAIREAERRLGLPHGWWGSYKDVRGPNGMRVRYLGGGGWIIRRYGSVISKHDSRLFAIRKASKLR